MNQQHILNMTQSLKPNLLYKTATKRKIWVERLEQNTQQQLSQTDQEKKQIMLWTKTKNNTTLE